MRPKKIDKENEIKKPATHTQNKQKGNNNKNRY